MWMCKWSNEWGNRVSYPRQLIAALLLAVTIDANMSVLGAQDQIEKSMGPRWGVNFPTCADARNPIALKAIIWDNPNIVANGIVNCTDTGDAYLYAVDYMNFSLSPTSEWRSAHLDWFGCGAQRPGPGGDNDWFYDEVRPIKVVIRAGVKRVAITNVSFRVPKSVIAQARGFGFYIVGGGLIWSIFLL